MRTFYTGNDIEDLVASGVRQLEVGAGVSLTDTARERAEELGVALVVPGAAPVKKAAVGVCCKLIEDSEQMSGRRRRRVNLQPSRREWSG